jgi:hypothetical protein
MISAVVFYAEFIAGPTIYHGLVCRQKLSALAINAQHNEGSCIKNEKFESESISNSIHFD